VNCITVPVPVYWILNWSGSVAAPAAGPAAPLHAVVPAPDHMRVMRNQSILHKWIRYQHFSLVDPHHLDADPDSTYHLDVDSDADTDSDFLFDADPDFYLMRIRIRIQILASK
jgi:hypothetical protein